MQKVVIVQHLHILSLETITNTFLRRNYVLESDSTELVQISTIG